MRYDRRSFLFATAPVFFFSLAQQTSQTSRVIKSRLQSSTKLFDPSTDRCLWVGRCLSISNVYASINWFFLWFYRHSLAVFRHWSVRLSSENFFEFRPFKVNTKTLKICNSFTFSKLSWAAVFRNQPTLHPLGAIKDLHLVSISHECRWFFSSNHFTILDDSQI